MTATARASAAPARLRVAVLGAGPLGSTVVDALAAGSVRGCMPAGVIRSTTSLADAAAVLASAHVVVEAAGVAGVAQWLPHVVGAGLDAVLCSCAALVDDALHDLVRRGPGRVFVPAGAIGGFDLLRAAVRGSADPRDVEVTLTTTKTAAALGGGDGGGSTTVFRGSARDAGVRFPKTANVAVALGLATIGIDRVDVTVVADPAVTRTRHHIRVRSPIGDYEVTAENTLAAGSGGRTSAVTAWSVISTLEALADDCCPALLLSPGAYRR